MKIWRQILSNDTSLQESRPGAPDRILIHVLGLIRRSAAFLFSVVEVDQSGGKEMRSGIFQCSLFSYYSQVRIA